MPSGGIRLIGLVIGGKKAGPVCCAHVFHVCHKCSQVEWELLSLYAVKLRMVNRPARELVLGTLSLLESLENRVKNNISMINCGDIFFSYLAHSDVKVFSFHISPKDLQWCDLYMQVDVCCISLSLFSLVVCVFSQPPCGKTPTPHAAFITLPTVQHVLTAGNRTITYSVLSSEVGPKLRVAARTAACGSHLRSLYRPDDKAAK